MYFMTDTMDLSFIYVLTLELITIKMLFCFRRTSALPLPGTKDLIKPNRVISNSNGSPVTIDNPREHGNQGSISPELVANDNTSPWHAGNVVTKEEVNTWQPAVTNQNNSSVTAGQVTSPSPRQATNHPNKRNTRIPQSALLHPKTGINLTGDNNQDVVLLHHSKTILDFTSPDFLIGNTGGLTTEKSGDSHINSRDQRITSVNPRDYSEVTQRVIHVVWGKEFLKSTPQTPISTEDDKGKKFPITPSSIHLEHGNILTGFTQEGPIQNSTPHSSHSDRDVIRNHPGPNNPSESGSLQISTQFVESTSPLHHPVQNKADPVLSENDQLVTVSDNRDVTTQSDNGDNSGLDNHLISGATSTIDVNVNAFTKLPATKRLTEDLSQFDLTTPGLTVDLTTQGDQEGLTVEDSDSILDSLSKLTTRVPNVKPPVTATTQSDDVIVPGIVITQQNVNKGQGQPGQVTSVVTPRIHSSRFHQPATPAPGIYKGVTPTMVYIAASDVTDEGSNIFDGFDGLDARSSFKVKDIILAVSGTIGCMLTASTKFPY